MKGRDSLTGGLALRAAAPLARWRDATFARSPSPRRRLALAFAVSLLLHVGLLSSLRGSLGGTPLPEVLYVTLAPPLRDSAAVAAPPPPAAPPPQVAEQRAPEKPAPLPAAPAARPPAVGEPAAGDSANSERAARPLGWPLIDPALRKELVARKLRLRISVEADGSVGGLEFNNAELSPATLATLKDAISRVRFAPGTRDGREAASLFSTRLCFDDEGQFDQSSAECWRAPER